MEPLLILSPDAPPARGGLADHTDRLATVLQDRFAVTVLTSPGAEARRPYTVRGEIGDWQSAARVSEAVERWRPVGPILWQYVPHMYGRGGVNLGLPRVMKTLRRRGRRQVVLAHEVAAGWSPWPHRIVYALAHRWMWRGVLGQADAVGLSTERWLERWRRVQPCRAALFFAPSPSNIPIAPVAVAGRSIGRDRLGLGAARRVVGFFGSPGPDKRMDWVVHAWRLARRRDPATALVSMGGLPAFRPSADEAAWYRATGHLPGPQASETLQALDVLALPFLDGVSERRSSFMAGLAHGLAVVATVGPATGSSLRDSAAFEAVAERDGMEAFGAAAAALLEDDTRRTGLGQRAQDYYRSHYDWPCLADRLLPWLRGSGASRSCG
ncbi:MAG: glycosyltransferase family 4 protein [Verrucomicrobiae bacterium]|nr:glycosyltransferase family 4 protein [Verrucomicrobiae bacterium]